MPEFPVKLELSRMSRPDVYLLLAPFLPGGSVLGAIVVRNWPLAARFIYSHSLAESAYAIPSIQPLRPLTP
jgi:hypothetical protein